MITYDPDLKIFTSSLINGKGCLSGFSTKDQGDGKKHVENIFKFFDSNNIEYKKIITLEQIHSVNIAFFNGQNNEKLEKIEETDGVITKDKGTVLTVVTADCCPIVFSEADEEIIGISHQGWRGSVKRMVQKMVDNIIEAGGNIENIKVAFGPAIGQCCYDIDEDRYSEFREEFDGYSDKIFYMKAGKRYLNLAKLNYLLLLEKGVKKENIDFFPFCTKCDINRFFSFRRDKKENYGEMFSFILMI